ncbi:MAG: MarR family transcriptional regulator [Clostridia bacterium]|nr:MarR family transcriptional regulator [Clostridia bacterium]
MDTEWNDKYAPIRLKNQLCFPLYACAKEVVRSYREPLEKLGLTYTQYVVMMVFWEYGDMTEGELGARVHLDSGTLAPLLKRLEKQGLIRRMRQEGNERKLRVALTPAGKALKEEALSVPEAMQGCLPLPEKELLELKRILDLALKNMEEQK